MPFPVMKIAWPKFIKPFWHFSILLWI